MRPAVGPRCVLLAACLLASPLLFAAENQTPDFDREVRPIFADNCFQCHGPDEKARKAKLRFDTREGAFRVLEGKSVIVPGKSGESELIQRVTNTDPDEVMPPPKSNHKLTAKQIETLRRWVDSGANWSRHWAFNPIANPPPPAVKNRRWCANPIDQFVLARLEKEGLRPSAQADPERLLRRVTFDLTGLPPTVAELDAFLADHSNAAYEKAVERLLNSPRYGERLAVEWLDLARFADTYGYQMDAPRPMWPYRDWVIKAFNSDLPFDKFVTWQLAGDLLPHATREQRLATAFNRLHLQNEEGGVVDEEFRVAYVDDRVDTFGAAFLGLTLQCAHCHDHKYDPITMRDFYSLFAMFQNIDESGQNPFSGFVTEMPAPSMMLCDDATDKRLADLARRIGAEERGLGAMRESGKAVFERWLKSKGAKPEPAGLVAAFAFDEMKDGKTPDSADSTKPGNVHEKPLLIEGKIGKAVELDGESGFTFPGIGHFGRTDPFSIALWLRPGTGARQVVVHHTKAPADAGSRGYELLIEEGHITAGVHHQWPGNSLKLRAVQPVVPNQWTHVTMTYDGSSKAAGLKLYINGKPAQVEVVRDHLWNETTYSGGEPELALGFRFRDSGFKGGAVDDFRVFNRELTRLEAAEVAGLDDFKTAWDAAPASLSASQREGLSDYYFARVYPPALQAASELSSVRRQQSKAVEAVPEIMVMEELPQPKPAYVLKRGAYDQHGEAVTANVPAVLPALPPGAPRNRLGLAQWLTATNNPLLARVTVNRAWQMMFGRGLVETVDNFGSRGDSPSHPALLDWLAFDFMRSGWDYKRLLKQIALSATYRQSSIATEALMAGDPENRLLARGPAKRLTAEMLRDQALAAGGLLVEKLGGPSVKPYQPPGLWEIAMGNPKYEQGHGEDLHRRSLYTFWKRTVPPPAMSTLDAPERNVCVARRQSTSTPLQALCLLNDVQMTEAARFISQRILEEGGTNTEQRLVWAFRLVTSRHPNRAELDVLTKLFEEQLEIFRNDPDAAAKLLTVGETPNASAFPVAELAAGTVLAEALLNHDEAIMRR